jgi:hypothetical protein
VLVADFCRFSKKPNGAAPVAVKQDLLMLSVTNFIDSKVQR